MTRILVTGASGLLGLNFSLEFASQHEVIGVVNLHGLRNIPFQLLQVDLSLPGAAERMIEQVQPDVIFHCAALANVDRCEQDPEIAYRINAEVPGEIATVCRRLGIRLVHISTDAVFDGLRGHYTESDATSPINIYARSKQAGEMAVIKANPDAIIARVNFYGWSLGGQRSLAEIFYQNLSSGKRMLGFTDVLFCPLHVNQLAEILITMVDKKLTGLYHVVSSESLSKYEFGAIIARIFGLDANLITPSSWKDAGLRAARSPNLTLNCEKLKKVLGMETPGQISGITRLFEQYRDGLPQQMRNMDNIGGSNGNKNN
jgi:dTDP-4-dehydrorhamnose reductase